MPNYQLSVDKGCAFVMFMAMAKSISTEAILHDDPIVKMRVLMFHCAMMSGTLG